MLHKQQLRKQIIQYFRSVGSGQNILQCIKQALFLHQNFNPVLLFQVLSKGKQKITLQDWRNYLLEHNVNFNEQQFKYFLKQNQYKSEITLNEFLQSMIPFNADVVRQFKQKYLESLEIRQFDPEIQFIFSQLIDNEFKLFRNLITIRQEITKTATLKQILSIVKEDLVLQSKPRQGRKFHEAFQQRAFKLGFHELRKFFQLWISGKQIIHQFYMLNIIRHLKSDDPFCNLIYKPRKNKPKAVQKSTTKRAQSEKIQKGVNLTNEKLKQKLFDYNISDRYQGSSHGKTLNQSEHHGFSQYHGKDKYIEFKDKMLNQYIQSRKQALYKQHDSAYKNQKNDKQSEQKGNISQQQKDALRRSRDLRESQGIDGVHIVKFLQQMVIKEKNLESLRKTLAKSNDFNLINLFKLLDSKNKGFVTAKDVTDFTLIGKVQFNHMINFYARQPDRLRFHEFCLIFRPLSKQLNELIDSRPQHKVPNPFKGETNKMIFEVLTLTAQMHSNLTKLKQKMFNEGMNSKSLFQYLDLNIKGYLDAQSLENVLKQHGILYDDKSMKCLMKLFRKKIDQRITILQFNDFISL